ncbi:unnamed protein product [Mucor hiemalis]
MDKILPYETLSQIFEYLKDDQHSLKQLNSCCRKLYKSTIPFLFRSPQFTTFSGFEKFAGTLTTINGVYVRHLDLHMVPHRWDSTKINSLLYTLTKKTPDLELLNLNLCSQLTNDALRKITEPLHDLRVLSVNQCELINDKAITALVKQCPYLQQLYLGSTHISDNSLTLIATKLILLTHLHLPGCIHISEVGVEVLTRECKTLQHFDITDCYNVVGNFDISSRITDETNRAVTIQSEDEWEDIDEEDQD